MPYRALVCDDDSPIRHMLRDLLEAQGVSVIEAVDGLQALALFRNNAVDLVVTDFLMPRLDGMQLIRGIRQSERARIPIVLMSAISKDHIPADAQAAPDYYIDKPFKPKKVAKLLERVLEDLARRAKG